MGEEVDGKSARLVVAAAIKVLAAAVFLGWLMMWIMSPTNTYWLRWQPKLSADTNSTYFGAQGTYILIYTFPVLFIAVLGCVYLHLVKGTDHRRRKQSGGGGRKGVSLANAAVWKRPALVRGPLGIVSWTELAFAAMFLALLLWCFSHFLIVGFSFITPQSAAERGDKVWQAKLESAGLRLGLLGNICCAFLFFPVTRGSSLLPLAGLTSEGSVKYHIWLGHVVMVLFTAHGLCYVIFWASTSSLSSMLEWAKTGVSNVAGEVALVCGLALWATTFPAVRRRAFEVFFYTHQLYVLFLLFYLLHVGVSCFCLILPGVYLFLLDRFLRFLQSGRRVCLVSARLLPGDTVELNFFKNPGLEYNPLSVVFINLPALSKLQWHPITVTSNSNLEPNRLSVVVKKEGSWSEKLHQLLSSPSSLDRAPDVSLEGPYEPASNGFLSYDSLVMVSGGSGITPFFSIIREFIFRSAAGDSYPSTPTIHLICAFKTAADLFMLDLLLPISSDASGMISRLWLHIDAFVTREKAAAAAAAAADSGKHIRTVWFKPRPLDLPVSAALGPRSWLWLAAVISASFAAFLLLLGVLNRCYIYPIDKNTNKVYSYSARALLNLLLLCGCMGAASSAAFLWNKRAAAAAASSVDTRQVQSMDGTTPVASPGSWFYNADRELESVPLESLVRSTNVHFGTRPDLKKMLLELDCPNTGVLVSGPREMRREVARICSSGLAQNLHFESMSFSW